MNKQETLELILNQKAVVTKEVVSSIVTNYDEAIKLELLEPLNNLVRKKDKSSIKKALKPMFILAELKEHDAFSYFIKMLLDNKLVNIMDEVITEYFNNFITQTMHESDIDLLIDITNSSKNNWSQRLTGLEAVISYGYDNNVDEAIIKNLVLNNLKSNTDKIFQPFLVAYAGALGFVTDEDIERLCTKDVLDQGLFKLEDLVLNVGYLELKERYHLGMPIDAYVEIDKIAPTEVVMSIEPKVGRNDPCPCNSGKKYKKCCGK